MRRKCVWAGLAIAIAGGGLAAAGPASAAFPGENGEIAFVRTTGNGVGTTGAEGTRELRTIDPATGVQRVLATGATSQPSETSPVSRSGDLLGGPEFTADGKRLVVSAYESAQNDSGLYMPNELGFVALQLPTGSGLRVLDPQSGAELCRETGGSRGGGRHQYDAARDRVLLTRSPSADFPPFFFDGPRELFNTSCGAEPGAAPGQLESQFALSPDGTRMVVGADFTANNPPSRLVVQDADGTNASAPVDVGGLAYGYDWAPDGSEIVFGSQEDGTESGSVKALDPDTGAIRTIVEVGDNSIFFPTFSPDGTKIAYSRTTEANDAPRSRLYVVDADRDATDPSAAAPVALTSLSGDELSADTQPDWGPKPTSPPPTAPPAPAAPGAPAPPGAPAAGDAVCNEVPERATSKKGEIEYTKAGLRIQQRIDAAVIRRLNAVNRWLDEGIVPTDLCAGAFGPGAFQANMAFVGGAAHDPSPPTPRDITIVKKNKSGDEITRSTTQLEINEQIGRVLRARAQATLERINSLTGGNLAPGAELAGREAYPGLAPSGPKPPPAEVPAAELEVGALPKKIKIVAGASTMKLQQKRSQTSIILANRALDAINGGLTEEHFVPGSIGSDRI